MPTAKLPLLVTSAHYYLSDKYGSEPQWSVDICRQYALLGYQVIAIASVVDLAVPLPANVKLLYLLKHRPRSTFLETCLRFLHPFWSFFASLITYVIYQGNFSLIHHIAPLSPVSFDLFFISGIASSRKKLIGPAVPPGVITSAGDITLKPGIRPGFSTHLVAFVYKLAVPVFHQLFKWTLSSSSLLIAATTKSRDYYSQFIPLSKIRVVPIGVNQISSPPLVKNHQTITILAVANLTHRKGIDCIIQSCAILKQQYQLTNFKLVVVGSGPEEGSLHALVNELHLHQEIAFAGFIAHNAIYKYYQTADIFCNPTRSEPYGMTTIEAMSYGLPVVASSVDSLPEIVGPAGLLFQADDIQALSKSLADLITDSHLRFLISQRSHHRYVKLFTWPNIVPSYIL